MWRLEREVLILRVLVQSLKLFVRSSPLEEVVGDGAAAGPPLIYW